MTSGARLDAAWIVLPWGSGTQEKHADATNIASRAATALLCRHVDSERTRCNASRFARLPWRMPPRDGCGLLWPGLLWPISTLASSTMASSTLANHTLAKICLVPLWPILLWPILLWPNFSCLVFSFLFFVFLSSSSSSSSSFSYLFCASLNPKP